MILTMKRIVLTVISALIFHGKLSHAMDDDMTILLEKEEFQYQAEEEGIETSFRTIKMQDRNPNIPEIIAPKCWKTATRILLELTTSTLSTSPSPPSSSTNTRILCQHMSGQHQKFLALEIAKCHLHDMGLELYQHDSDFVHQHCDTTTASTNSKMVDDRSSSSSSSTSSWDVTLFLHCLKFLSPEGIHAYTHYVVHVQMLCTRLTNDVVLTYQREAHDRLRDQFHEMSQQSLTQINVLKQGMAELMTKMEGLAELSENVRDEMKQDFLRVWDETTLNITRGIEESMNSYVKEQLATGTAQLLQSLSEQHHCYWEQLLTKIGIHEHEQEMRHQEWMKEQGQLLDAQAQGIAEQRRALAHQRDHITNMTALVADATQHMKPLSSMEYYVRAVISGYGWATTILFVLCTLNVTWLVTSLSITKGLRPYLLTLFWIEGTIEFLVRLSCAAGSSASDECQRLINDIRLLSLMIAFVTFVFGIAWSTVRYVMTAWKKHGAVEDVSSDSYSEHQHVEHVPRVGVGYRHGCTVHQPHNNTATNWEGTNIHPGYYTTGNKERTLYRMSHERSIALSTEEGGGQQFHRCIRLPRQQALARSRPETSLVASPASLSQCRPIYHLVPTGGVEPAKTNVISPSDTSTVPCYVPLSRCHHTSRNASIGGAGPSEHDVSPQAPTNTPLAHNNGTLHGSRVYFECRDVDIDETHVGPRKDLVLEKNRTVLDSQSSKKRPRCSSDDKKDWSGSLNKKSRYIETNY